MKFGVREICDVVLKAKAAQKIGNKVFYAGEPVIYFDTLKTSSMEGAATTVYAQGGRGNARLMAWEGERTVTFTMEDALISPEGFMILSGAGLVEPTTNKPIYQHMTETIDAGDVVENSTQGTLTITLKEDAYLGDGKEHMAYVMLVKNGTIVSEPYIALAHAKEGTGENAKDVANTIVVADAVGYTVIDHEPATTVNGQTVAAIPFPEYDSVIVDYYTPQVGGAKQIEITADKFGGNYYLEASTLFRDTNGVDMPAEFIIPNCKVQSNFTFTMASSGDPSSFTFTMDAFPDYTRFDRSKKVLAVIQIIEKGSASEIYRTRTVHDPDHEAFI